MKMQEARLSRFKVRQVEDHHRIFWRERMHTRMHTPVNAHAGIAPCFLPALDVSFTTIFGVPRMATITIKTGKREKPRSLHGLVRTALHREQENLRFALDRTQHELSRFEEHYKLSSAKFYRNYQSGKLDDRDDFIDWSGEYQIYILIKEQIASLKGLKIDSR